MVPIDTLNLNDTFEVWGNRYKVEDKREYHMTGRVISRPSHNLRRVFPNGTMVRVEVVVYEPRGGELWS
jgi:hypothetical protein